MKLIQSLLLALLCNTFAGAQVITTVAGTGVKGYTGDGGPATAGKISIPFGIAFDSRGNFYFTSASFSAYGIVRSVSASGILSTYAGVDTLGGYSGDGGPATAARFGALYNLAVDTADNLYVTEWQQYTVRKISAAGIVTTVAGRAYCDTFSGDGGAATAGCLDRPEGVAVDRKGNIFVATRGRVRKINAAGVITTIAGDGTYGGSGDGGPSTAARVYQIVAMTTDSLGNLYLAEAGGSVIRKIDTSGIITTIAGTIGRAGYGGDGGPATAAFLNTPRGVAVNSGGTEIFIADYFNSRIRKVDASGIISTVVGNGTIISSPDGTPATAAGIPNPIALAMSKQGDIYFSDGVGLIRRTGYPTLVYEVDSGSSYCMLYPNPSSGSFTIQFPSSFAGSTAVISLYNAVAQEVYRSTVAVAGGTTTITPDVANGTYRVSITAQTRQYTGQVVIHH